MFRLYAFEQLFFAWNFLVVANCLRGNRNLDSIWGNSFASLKSSALQWSSSINGKISLSSYYRDNVKYESYWLVLNYNQKQYGGPRCDVHVWPSDQTGGRACARPRIDYSRDVEEGKRRAANRQDFRQVSLFLHSMYAIIIW